MTELPYATAAAVESAIKSAATNASADDPSVSVTDRIRQAHFDRFLCRVFAEVDESAWLLKGGTGMLARVPNARRTKDVDLFRAELSLDAALADLRRLVAADLRDHFRFEYADHQPISQGEGQPHTNGYRVTFATHVGVRTHQPINVDLVVSAGITGEVEVVEPASRLPLRVQTAPYRLYPIVDQAADKVCATMEHHSGLPSTREWDLIDLVVIAVTHDIDAEALRRAIAFERETRGLPTITAFTAPSGWGRIYRQRIRETPFAGEFGSVEAALALMRSFLDPVLSGASVSGTWSHTKRAWA